MTRLVAAELLKLRTIRATWGYVFTAVVLAALVTAGTIGSESQTSRLEPDFQHRLVVDAAGATIILALLLGITLVTNEFRHGTITPTLLVAPRRDRVLGAKFAAGVATAIALVATAVIVIVAIALIWLAVLDVPLELGDAARGAGRVVLSAAIAGLLGVAVGGVVHAQVAALVGTLVWLFVAEPLLGGLLGLGDAEGVAEYLPGAVIFALGDPSSDGLQFWPAVAVGAAYVAGGAVLAALRTGRRDIT